MRSKRAIAVVRGLALFGARRPFLAVAIGLLLLAVSARLVLEMKISTSRRDLISGDHPTQKRAIEFDEKFGYTNTPAIVVTGGTVDERHRVVDALEVELEKLPLLERRVLGRVGPEKVAEVLLLADPEAIAKALPGGDLGAARAQLAEGLPGWLSLVNSGLEKGLEEGSATPDETKAGLERLAKLFDALDAELGGEEGLDRLAEIDKEGRRTYARGLDAKGYLAGDGDHHVVGLFPKLEGDEGYQLAPIVKAIREARDRAVLSSQVSGVRADVTGVPALATDELAMVTHDLTVTAIASSIAILLTLYLAFRSLRQALVSFLPLAFGTVVTFGITALVLGKLNLITASFTSVLLGLGDFGVHIQARHSELLRGGASPKEAMETALLKSGPALVVTTVTTAVAFLTTMATDFTAFAELGFITSVGLVVMLGGTYLLVPPVLTWLLGKKPRPAPELPGFRALARFVRAWPRAIVCVSVVTTMTLAIWIPRVTFNGRYFEFLPKDVESARGLAALDEDKVVSPFVAIVRARSIDEARGLAEKLRALPTVSSVETPSDLLPELTEGRLAALRKIRGQLEADGKPVDLTSAKDRPVDKALLAKRLSELMDTLDEVGFAMREAGRDTKPAEEAKDRLRALRERIAAADPERIASVQRAAVEIVDRAVGTARAVAERGSYAPADLPPLFQHRFVSKDETEFALFVHPRGDVWDVPVADAFTAELRTVSSEVSGIATTLGEHPRLIVSGFERATLLAGIFLALILLVTFRKPVDVFAAALPLAFGAMWMIGTMPLLGFSFNHANLVALPLLLGLGLEASAHVVTRYRESAAESGGVAKLDDILAGGGSATFIGTLTTVWGFTVMIFADYRAIFGLGVMMTIGKGAALAASLLVVPAALVWLKKAE